VPECCLGFVFRTDVCFFLFRPSADKKSNTSDPYVVVKIFGLKKTAKKKKTAVIKHNLNPVWGEKMSFDVSDVRVEALHFTVFDKDMFGSQFMGQVTLTMK
jgi:Ca2+-dependent lipid-binding protein